MVEMDLISKAWPIILSMVAVIAWNVRLSHRIDTAEKDIKGMKQDHKDVEKSLLEKVDALQSTLHRVLESLGEIKGRINHN